MECYVTWFLEAISRGHCPSETDPVPEEHSRLTSLGWIAPQLFFKAGASDSRFGRRIIIGVIIEMFTEQ